MKKIFISFVALMALCTGAWGAGTLTKLGNGKFLFQITTTDVATANNWTDKTKNDLKLNDYLNYKGYGANLAYNKQADNSIGGRAYESQNNLGASVVSITSGVIDSIMLTYVVYVEKSVSTSGVLCSTKDTAASGAPIPEDKRYLSGVFYPVNAASFSFYAGRTDRTKKNGRCDITKWSVAYTLYPSSIIMDENKTVSVGNEFQLGLVTPVDAYQEWSSNKEDVVSVDQNGVIKALKTGEATITVTSPKITKTCVVTVVAASDKSFTEDYAKLTKSSGSYVTDQVIYTADNGIGWQFRHYKFEDATKIEGNPGVDMNCNGYNSYIAYLTPGTRVGQEGGVKRISFQWKAVDPTKPLRFEIDDSNVSGSAQVMCLPANATSGTQFYSYDMNDKGATNKDVALRVRNIKNASNSSIIVGPLTITPYLLYTNKDTVAYLKDGAYTNTSLINNTGETPTYSISCGADTAEIDANGAITIKKDAAITVTATWGNVKTTYQLTMHAKDAPEVVFSDTTVTLNQLPFTPVPTKIPATGMGEASYSSSDKGVVKVNATSGELTIVGEGVATINVHYEEGASYASADVAYQVTVTDPKDDAIVEDFNDAAYGASDKVNTLIGKVAAWEYQYARRRYSGDNDFDTLQNGSKATWLNYVVDAHLKTTDVLEGGIKRVGFLWNRISTGDRIVEFVVSTGDDLLTKDTVTKAINQAVARVTPDFVYNHNFFTRKNSKLSINGTGKKDNKESYMVLGDITIVPYLLYTVKMDSIDMAATTTYTNEALIDNRDNAEAIAYSIVEGDCATVDANGLVTASKEGVVKVQAKWADVTTTYTLKVKDSAATGLIGVDAQRAGVRKMMKDGQLYIIRDANMYNAQGTLIK